MTLSEKDQLYNWHPYTQHQTIGTLPAIVKGKDALLWDQQNKEYIDAIASWWVNPFGHSNEFIAKAIYDQLITLEHVLFGGFTHNKAVELAEKLVEILPPNQKKFFYSDNGSTAVEIAIKASFQYFFNKGIKKDTIIAFEDAFHGDTFGAMAVSGIGLFTEAFQDSLIKVIRIPVPIKGKEEISKKAIQKALQEHQVAAFIFEPLVLGAAGMIMYEPAILDELITICKNNSVFTIADEVMTGFGKTGLLFACHYLKENPDMMCLSKALTGGTIPMAITSFTDVIFNGFKNESVNHAFFHGHTFTANPTGCAAALASIQLLQRDETQKNIYRIHQQHLLFQSKIKLHPKVKTSRVKGVIFALEVVTNQEISYYGSIRNKLYNFFIEKGIILRPVGNIIYILPPYIITDQQLEKIYSTIEEALSII
ncbi:adenosylmethionine--8-amino-7-oxononanoate transaminase [Flavobacterium oreochromis]|uniref:Adenosylmethionine-8-amino-7-oxononanoate aminotransferase n=2 Tax=Flavobacterium TaxID=237 RepID=A0A246GA31_9FLAO|nr:adenosylmethionine--8-amino-7-oxononanoate transaminase [Flavobacterium oreochromis]OWP76666.1 adenosylmethionine--8-amino-7-oxononanoate transaminase [Flavobacterium oreochromis]OWP78705.1 adenosylmethionine--8-amino-7-oxononanoate transaminase [Flavobacterium oreochromis]POR25657.1 adenosylmethionine--8-amino-7-oxononanoate transaminase [Flavobacterium columnare]QYS87502.1 adenosylmethionine--8-amino-7-oxononanoate transaminase [Flavobacterium oreochromis]